MRTKSFVFAVVSGLLWLPAWGQEATGDLKIVVLAGENAVNNIRSKIAVPPAVEVRDQNDQPVVGAEVVFRLPASGAGGVFSGWLDYQVVKTDEKGRAAASGLTPNDQEGRFNIKVTATQGKRSGTVVIAQTNTSARVEGTSKSHTKLYVILGAVAVGAVVGGVAAAHGSGSSAATAATNPISISAGPIGVGGPH